MIPWEGKISDMWAISYYRVISPSFHKGKKKPTQRNEEEAKMNIHWFGKVIKYLLFWMIDKILKDIIFSEVWRGVVVIWGLY